MPTASTVPLIFMMVVLWRATKGELLSVVLVSSIFDAASVLNIGGSGVAPWTFALAAGLMLKLLVGLRRPRFIPGCNKTAVRLLLVFVGYSIWTGMTYPFLFHGVPVFSSHGAGLLTPLSWGTANLFQVIYLLAVLAIYLYAMTSTRDSLRTAVTWYLRGCLVICFFAFYQLANATLHIPYPSAVLYSNPGHVIYPAYRINGMWRLNSTLSEASAMAFHLSIGLALQAYQVLTQPFRWRSSMALAALFVCLLLTQSSGGYLCLAFILVTLLVVYVGHLLRAGAIPRPLFLGYLLLAMTCTVAAVTSEAPEIVRKEINSVILEKKNSSSYRERSASNVAAMQTARATYYMGAGYGSLRCSGLGYMLIGNVGVPGLLLFLAFLGSLCLPLLLRQKRQAQGNLYHRTLFATLVTVFAAALAGSEPVAPILWVLFAAASAGPQLQQTRYRILSPAIETTIPLLSY